ncbi:MAG TPA: hypothetical protein VKC51_07135 [Lacunisphaera sp.]|nr:hypothetical protein [Lacunisphaera sp.]
MHTSARLSRATLKRPLIVCCLFFFACVLHAEEPSKGTIVSPVVVKLQNPPSQKTVTASSTKEANEKPSEREMVNLTKILAVIAILTLLGFSWQLWQTQQSSEQGLRAYVGIVPRPKEENKTTAEIFKITIINCGHTPAYHLSTLFSWRQLPGQYTPWPKSEPYQIFGNAISSVMTLVPQHEAVIEIPFGPTQNGIPFVNFLASAIKGEITLYFYGTIKYQDVFKKWHETDFCFMLEPGTPNRMRVCDHHNDST